MSSTAVSHQEIELRAYQFWEDRGRPWGTPESDWFRAGRELTVPEPELKQVAREAGALVGTAVAFLTDLTSGLTRPNDAGEGL